MLISRALLANRPADFLLRLLNRHKYSRFVLQSLAGFRRPFATMQEARQAAEKIGLGSHEEQSNIELHLKKGESARLSDYPVLFWLQECLLSTRKVLDLGGNVGNLFYCYEKYLQFPNDLTWTVFDLSRTLDAGRNLANQRRATKLRFVDQIDNLEEYDLLLVSGSMHYLEPSLLELLKRSSRRPRWVIINRVPLSERDTYFAVQKDFHIAVACRVEKLNSVKSGMHDLGYDLKDFWQITDRDLKLPFFPDYCVNSYSGLFFVIRH
ncbi:MAG TPA: methyltransferase, TIGR04325 family [Verrucomicrobiae bacterium]|nr:methyltransferase, TIGR04325 family [Verrucomicrobiae bacterium]